MKHIVTLLVSSLIFLAMHAQPYPQIRFKPGISLLFPSPGGRGYAFKTVPGIGSSVVIGAEFSHPFKNKKGAWQVGFTFQDGVSQPSPNKRNLLPMNQASPPSGGFSFLGAPAKTVIYGGFEKYINRDYTRPSKNYFSVVGGVGLAFTLNKLKDWEYTSNATYMTRDGGIVNGYTSRFVAPSFPVAVSLYGGLRYNITNRKGNEVLIIELVVNYGLTPYYKQTIDYVHNGVPRTDVLKEKGANIQLNLIVPLHSFYGKHHSRAKGLVY